MRSAKSLCTCCHQMKHADEVIHYGKRRMCLECIEAERRHQLYNLENVQNLRRLVADLTKKLPQ